MRMRDLDFGVLLWINTTMIRKLATEPRMQRRVIIVHQVKIDTTDGTKCPVSVTFRKCAEMLEAVLLVDVIVKMIVDQNTGRQQKVCEVFSSCVCRFKGVSGLDGITVASEKGATTALLSF